MQRLLTTRRVYPALSNNTGAASTCASAGATVATYTDCADAAAKLYVPFLNESSAVNVAGCREVLSATQPLTGGIVYDSFTYNHDMSSSVQCDDGVSHSGQICHCVTQSQWRNVYHNEFPPPSPPPAPPPNTAVDPIAIGIIAGGVLLLLILILIYWCVTRRRGAKGSDEEKSRLADTESAIANRVNFKSVGTALMREKMEQKRYKRVEAELAKDRPPSVFR